MLAPAGLMSAFIYNTPTIGMLAPQVAAWARRGDRPPSWYLLPLNFVVLLGGAGHRCRDDDERCRVGAARRPG